MDNILNCMKCGKEISANQVFCQECLDDMQLHPVKPGTPVLLPPREKQATIKHSTHKRTHKPDEIIGILRKVILWMLLTIVVLIVALSISIILLVRAAEAPEARSAEVSGYTAAMYSDAGSQTA